MALVYVIPVKMMVYTSHTEICDTVNRS